MGSLDIGVTVAIKASVSGAYLAGLFEPLPQLATRAMQAHLQVVFGDSYVLRDRFGRLPLEVRQL